MGTDTTVLSPEQIENREFTGTLRGFDPAQVRTFLSDVAGTHEELLAHITRLEAEIEALTADLHARTEESERLTIGEEDPLLEEMRRATSQVIVAAQDAAMEMRLSAEVEAEQHLAAAREEAAAVVAGARRSAEDARQTVLDGARREADEILAEAHREQEAVRAHTAELESRRIDLARSLEQVRVGARALVDELEVPAPPQPDPTVPSDGHARADGE